MKRLFVLAAAAIVLSAAFDLDEEEEAFVQKILEQMTTEEKVGQMTQADCGTDKVAAYGLGSVLRSCGNSAEEQATAFNKQQQAALSTRLRIPLIWGQDAVHGLGQHNSTVFPHNIGLGCSNDIDLLYRMGQVVAEEIVATGQMWAFAPCLAVSRDKRWGRTYESFSEDPNIVRDLGSAYIKGIQEPTRFEDYRVIACAKHYMGDGGTTFGTGWGGYKIDQGDTQVDEETLRAIHLPGYLGALEQDVPTVMVSFSSWNGVKMHEQKYLVTDVLKGELKFNGFIVSDMEGCNQLEGEFHEKAAKCVNAGIDMIMNDVGNFENFHTGLQTAVDQGLITMDRINDAVTRILRVKHRLGLFDRPYYNETQAQKHVGSAEHRAVAREAVRKSVVLLKNEGDILPLSKTAKILVTGYSADRMGAQLGGWSVGWQGNIDTTENEVMGTTLVHGLRNAVGDATITFSEDAANVTGQFDVAIAVIGEYPYAEGRGDSDTLAIPDHDKNMLSNLAALGLPTIAVIYSGRPVIITDYLPNWKAAIAAFLPGSEGGDGLADLIFGDYKFTGKLSMSWPKSVDQEPLNVGDATYEPLFAFGYGL